MLFSSTMRRLLPPPPPPPPLLFTKLFSKAKTTHHYNTLRSATAAAASTALAQYSFSDAHLKQHPHQNSSSSMLNFPSMRLLPPPFTKLLSKTTHHYTTTTTYSDSDSDEPQNNLDVLQKINSLFFQPSRALSFFTQLTQRGFSHDTLTYAAMIRILCFWGEEERLDFLFLDPIDLYKKDASFESKIHDLFEAVMGGGADVKGNYNHHHRLLRDYHLVRAFDGFIKACASRDMFGEAIDFLFQTKKNHGWILPNISACNFLINRMVEHGKVDEALSLFSKHFNTLGLSPNHYTYSIIIKALRTKGVDLIQAVFEVTPSPNAAFIEVLCNDCCSHLGYEVLQEARRRSAPIDVCAYSAVICGFCNETQLDKALCVLFYMLKQGVKPTSLIHKMIIEGLCSRGSVKEAVEYFNSLEEDNKSAEIYSAMVNCCEADLTKAIMLLDTTLCCIVFDTLCKLGKVDDAVAMLEELKGKHIHFDIKHYTTLISGYCLQGKLAEAVSMLKEMERRGFKPDIVTYNVLAAGLSRKGHACKPLLDYMEKQGVKPNSTTRKIIIEGLFSGGDVEEAEKYFNSLEDKSVEIYSALVNCYREADQESNAFSNPVLQNFQSKQYLVRL